ncbi:hypothetical protein HMPREF1982_03398 [Clostridiales bacterium oral taxon 876 str. F0540]|nr:hypothetical protein HMPREF1982_03398 [Clostridiales bacterium oral taxon 876 str. F0540]
MGIYTVYFIDARSGASISRWTSLVIIICMVIWDVATKINQY